MRRREFLLAATAAAASRRAGSQEVPKSEALARLGWVEGHNLTVERRITGGDPEQRKTAAIELVAANPGVIVAAGIADALTVHAQTHTLPIVVITGRDIVEAGLADSLAHPGGNVTGIVNLGGELDGKRIELLHELVPAATMTSGFAATSSMAAVLRRSGSPPVIRRSTLRLRPSTQPSCAIAQSKRRRGYASLVTINPIWALFDTSSAPAPQPAAVPAKMRSDDAHSLSKPLL